MTSRTPKACMLAMAVNMTAIVACAQAQFDLDTSFRTQIISKYVNSLVLMNTGNILASGQLQFPGDLPWSWRGSARLLPDGSRDPSFTAFTGGGKLTPWNGKYYVSNGLVRRLDSTGYTDPSFISMNTGPYFTSFQGGDYHVYPDGRILLSGWHELSDTARGFVGFYDLIWFSNQGYLDTTRTHRQGNGAIYAMKELPSGQFICTSTCTQFEGKAVDWIFKFNADGTPDTTFRSDAFEGTAGCFLPLTDGRIYAGGRFRRNAEPQDTLTLVRFMPDGSLDATWNIPYFDDGSLHGPNNQAFVHNIYDWGGGRLLVVGQFRAVNGLGRRAICMLDTMGNVLPEFDECGVDSFQVGGTTYAVVVSVTPDLPNGYIYLCGAYVHYSDATILDTTQRFVTRLFYDFTTGTPEVQQAEQDTWNILPNPAHSSVHVSWALPTALRNKGNAELSIVNAQGRLVRNLPCDLSREGMDLDVRELAAGIYHLHVVQSGVWITGGKLVVE